MKIVTEISKTIGKLFDFLRSKEDNQLTAEVLDDKDKLEKACEFAEKAFELVDDYAYFDSYRSRRRYEYYIYKFRKFK